MALIVKTLWVLKHSTKVDCDRGHGKINCTTVHITLPQTPNLLPKPRVFRPKGSMIDGAVISMVERNEL